MPKTRLDRLLVARGSAATRAKAQALVMAGLVFSQTKRLDKPGLLVDPEIPLEIKGKDHPWVSRGGLKLEHGLRSFAITPEGKTCLDLGASTGGFTDVLLHHGAARVHAVDVGYGQLAHKLRTDPRVSLRERTNARYLDRKQIPEPIDLVVCDASFISLKQILPAALALTQAEAHLVALIKPQFEVGKGRVGKGGVVRDPDLHRQVCSDLCDWVNGQKHWSVMGLVDSPITGPQGNREFLLGAEKN